MPKLIIDEAALRLTAAKLSGQPVFAGPDGEFLDPGVVEVLDEGSERWQPADERTKLVVLGAEACRDLVFHVERISDPTHRRRVLKGMSVQVCTLMDVVASLLTNLNDRRARDLRKSWPVTDQATYRDVGRRLGKKRIQGPVRKVRNKLGAHLDANAIGDRSLRLPVDELLGAMGDSLVLLLLAVNHCSSAFTWIRGLGVTEDGTHRIVETMDSYPVCIRWLTDAEGRVQDVGFVQLTADPRRVIQDHIVVAVHTYNALRKLESSALPEIWMMPRKDLLDAEQPSL